MPKIRIANPRPGSAKYTTISQAERFIRRGDAVITGDDLYFLSEAEKRHTQNIERQIVAAGRRASDVYINGVVWWDGNDAGGMHRPGERVS